MGIRSSSPSPLFFFSSPPSYLPLPLFPALLPPSLPLFLLHPPLPPLSFPFPSLPPTYSSPFGFTLFPFFLLPSPPRTPPSYCFPFSPSPPLSPPSPLIFPISFTFISFFSYLPGFPPSLLPSLPLSLLLSVHLLPPTVTLGYPTSLKQSKSKENLSISFFY